MKSTDEFKDELNNSNIASVAAQPSKNEINKLLFDNFKGDHEEQSNIFCVVPVGSSLGSP